jgi:ubiquinone/menaquinone biosynthesis C-methylase UbiE
MPGRDNLVSISKYRAHAAGYDATTRRTADIRRRTIAALALEPGQTVLDAGCGTGLSLPRLIEDVGTAGLVIGVEQSPEMFELARARVASHGWQNVTLIRGSVEEAVIPGPVDALLFHYAHDILRTPVALANLFAAARPGARVAVAGIKLFPWWLAPLNLYVYLKNAPYNARPGGLARPWRLLQRYVPDLEIEPTQLGMGYIGRGTFSP